MVMPAIIDKTTAPAGTTPCNSGNTPATIWGLMANTTTSASATASPLLATMVMPYWACMTVRRSARGSEAVM